MANNDSITAESSETDLDVHKAEPSIEQLKDALLTIIEMSSAIESLADQIIQGDEDGYLNVAVLHLAEKIGWTADRCFGFQSKTSDQWLGLSSIWEEKTNKI